MCYRSPFSTEVTISFVKHIAIMDVSVTKHRDLYFIILKTTASTQWSESQHSLPGSEQSWAIPWCKWEWNWYRAGFSPGSKTAYLTVEADLWALRKPNALCLYYSRSLICQGRAPPWPKSVTWLWVITTFCETAKWQTNQTDWQCISHVVSPRFFWWKIQGHFILKLEGSKTVSLPQLQNPRSWSADLFQGIGSLLRSYSPFEFDLKGFFLRVVCLIVQNGSDITGESPPPSLPAVPLPGLTYHLNVSSSLQVYPTYTTQCNGKIHVHPTWERHVIPWDNLRGNTVATISASGCSEGKPLSLNLWVGSIAIIGVHLHHDSQQPWLHGLRGAKQSNGKRHKRSQTYFVWGQFLISEFHTTQSIGNTKTL